MLQNLAWDLVLPSSAGKAVREQLINSHLKLVTHNLAEITQRLGTNHRAQVRIWGHYEHASVSNLSVLASLVAQTVKNLPSLQETQLWFLGWEYPLEKGVATHSSTVALIISWTEDPSILQSMGSQWVGHDWATNTAIWMGSAGRGTQALSCIFLLGWSTRNIVLCPFSCFHLSLFHQNKSILANV